MSVRLVALGFGAVFGVAMSWGQFVDPDRIRDMLLLRDPYLYLMMGTAVAVGFAGTRLLRRFRARALLTGDPVSWETEGPGAATWWARRSSELGDRRHLPGADRGAARPGRALEPVHVRRRAGGDPRLPALAGGARAGTAPRRAAFAAAARRTD